MSNPIFKDLRFTYNKTIHAKLKKIHQLLIEIDIELHNGVTHDCSKCILKYDSENLETDREPFECWLDENLFNFKNYIGMLESAKEDEDYNNKIIKNGLIRCD